MKNIWKQIVQYFKVKPLIMDGQELVSLYEKGFKYKLYVNEFGQLIYQDEIFNNVVTGACEWTTEVKRHLQIDPNITVLDMTSKA